MGLEVGVDESTHRSTSQPKGRAEGLLVPRPPIASYHHEDRPGDALHETEEEAVDHEAGEVGDEG